MKVHVFELYDSTICSNRCQKSRTRAKYAKNRSVFGGKVILTKNKFEYRDYKIKTLRFLKRQVKHDFTVLLLNIW